MLGAFVYGFEIAVACFQYLARDVPRQARRLHPGNCAMFNLRQDRAVFRLNDHFRDVLQVAREQVHVDVVHVLLAVPMVRRAALVVVNQSGKDAVETAMVNLALNPLSVAVESRSVVNWPVEIRVDHERCVLKRMLDRQVARERAPRILGQICQPSNAVNADVDVDVFVPWNVFSGAIPTKEGTLS